MGDHRADIKLKMVLHGKTYQTSMWINYWPESCDYRVVEWFRACWHDAHAHYEAQLAEYHAEVDAKRLEVFERSELERLKVKYKE